MSIIRRIREVLFMPIGVADVQQWKFLFSPKFLRNHSHSAITQRFIWHLLVRLPISHSLNPPFNRFLYLPLWLSILNSKLFLYITIVIGTRYRDLLSRTCWEWYIDVNLALFHQIWVFLHVASSLDPNDWCLPLFPHRHQKSIDQALLITPASWRTALTPSVCVNRFVVCHN